MEMDFKPKYTTLDEYDAYCEKLMLNIIPTSDPHPLTTEQFDELRPETMEYWSDRIQCDTPTTLERFIILCLYNVGLKKVLERLPEASKDELRELLNRS